MRLGVHLSKESKYSVFKLARQRKIHWLIVYYLAPNPYTNALAVTFYCKSENMKYLLTLFLISAFFGSVASAQLRSDLATPYDYTGPLINERAPTVQNGLNRFFSSIKMSHSYDMSFSSFGGSYQNVNTYTNTMQFSLSPRLDGRVDISFLHSPFGGNQNFSNMGNFQNQILIRNAELNYKISDKAFIRIQYQQLPSYGYGFSPYGFGNNRYNRYRDNYWMWY
jgi:hypothetical protein